MKRCSSYLPRRWVFLTVLITAIAGFSAMVWGAIDQWWGHLGNFSVSLVQASSWGFVAMACVGAGLTIWPTLGRFSWLPGFSVRPRRTVEGQLLSAASGGLVLGYLIVFLAGLLHVVIVGGFWWFSPFQVLSGLVWDMAGLFLGACVGRVIPQRLAGGALIIAPVLAYALVYVPVYLPQSSPIFNLAVVNVAGGATYTESNALIVARLLTIMALAVFLGAGALANESRVWIAAVALSICSVFGIVLSDGRLAAIPGAAAPLCQSMQGVDVCTDEAHRGDSASMFAAVGDLLSRTPTQLLPIKVDAASSASLSTPDVIALGFPSSSAVIGQRIDPALARHRFANELVSARCDSDLTPLLQLRTYPILGVPDSYTPPFGTSAEGVRSSLEGDAQAAMGRLDDMSDSEVVDLVTRSSCPSIRTFAQP